MKLQILHKLLPYRFQKISFYSFCLLCSCLTCISIKISSMPYACFSGEQEQEIWLSLSKECCNACLVKVRKGTTEVSIADTEYYIKHIQQGGAVKFGHGSLLVCQMDLRRINDNEEQPEFFKQKT